MTLYQYLILSDEQQYQTTWELGVHIDSILCEKTHYQLYAIGDFFVEILYNATDNTITGKNAFKTGELLEKYLRHYKL